MTLRIQLALVLALLANAANAVPLRASEAAHADAYAARLLLGPLSAHALVVAALRALAALPRALAAPPAPPRALRVDVRALAVAYAAERGLRVHAKLRDRGTQLILSAGKRAVSVPLPEPADARFTPVVANGSRGRLVVRVRTLRAAVADCAADDECMRALALSHCRHGVRRSAAVARLCLAQATGASPAPLARAAAILYRILFAALTMAQLAVFLWGVLFAITIYAVEASSAGEKVARLVIASARDALTAAVHLSRRVVKRAHGMYARVAAVLSAHFAHSTAADVLPCDTAT